MTQAATTAATQAATANGTQAATQVAAPTTTALPTATTNPNGGYLGIAAEQVQTCGARVMEVKPSSAAEKAGLQPGDVIVAVDGKKIGGLVDLQVAVRTRKAGDTISLTYERGNDQKTVTATLGAIPVDTTATQAATTAATKAATIAATTASTTAATTSVTTGATQAATAAK